MYGALVLVLCACAGEIDPPSAGQTGSPVSPDHETPVRFRPPPKSPGNETPDQIPRRPLPKLERSATFGDWLFAATPRGLFAVNTSDGNSAPLRLMPQLAVHWLVTADDRLDVIADALPDDPATVEQGPVTRLYRFDLSANPAEPRLLASVDLPGTLVQARREGARVITLTQPHTARCTPEGGAVPDFSGQLVVSEHTLQADTWIASAQVMVDGYGFVETDNGFVLLSRTRTPRRGFAVTVVEITPQGIEQWPPLSVDGELAPAAAMALAGHRLALFQTNDSLAVELAVYDADQERKLGAITVDTGAIFDNTTGAVFIGSHVLVPWLRSDEAPGEGVIIDWQGDGGPLVSGSLPADLYAFERVSERWLARGAERTVSFELSANGTFELTGEGPLLEGYLGHAVWALGDGRVLVPRMLGGPPLQAPPELSLAVLDLSQPAPVWRAGPRLSGRANLGLLTSAGERTGVAFTQTSSGLFALTDAGDADVEHWLLERIDLERSESEVVALADRSVATTLSREQSVATLLARYDQTRHVRVSQGSGAWDVALAHGAETISSFGERWLTSSLHYSNGCSTVDDLEPCLPAGEPGLSVGSFDRPRVLSEASLALSDSPRPERPNSRDWLEVVAQGEHVGVLEHRSIGCETRAACDALGVPFRVVPIDLPGSTEEYGVGSSSQLWLHPYDSASGTFDASAHLFDVDGSLGAENLRVDADAGAALTLFTPLHTDRASGEVDRAHIELVRYRDLSGAALAEPTRITVPGYPLYVGARRAVTIEPAGALGRDGEAPGVLVHRLALDGDVAYVAQTLELGSGGAGQRWANERGYVLLVGDERCADPTSTLVSVRLVGDRLEEAGRITLPGTSWQLREVSDSVALLARGVEGLVQHVVIDAAERELSLREYRTYPASVPASVRGDRVWFETGP